MSRPDRPDRRGDDGLVDAIGDRLSALLDRSTATVRLALAETRLAASSAALLLGIALAGVMLVFLIWLLLIVLAGYGLWQLGLTPALTLLVLVAVHVGIAIALGLAARRLAGDLSFAHTRRALSAGPDVAPTDPRPASPSPLPPGAPPASSPPSRHADPAPGPTPPRHG